MSTKTKTFIYLAALVVAVSAATSLATTYVQNKNNSNTNFIENAENPTQNARARFANAVPGIETDFTVAADLTVKTARIRSEAMAHSARIRPNSSQTTPKTKSVLAAATSLSQPLVGPTPIRPPLAAADMVRVC